MPEKRRNQTNPDTGAVARNNPDPPLILAPAGNPDAFMAALAAGADAIYCGLKRYSARMAATNFSVTELAGLSRLAHDHNCKLYIAFNAMLTPDDLKPAARLLDQLNRCVQPDALIFQDLAIIQLARQVGFQGELHLSTLANVSIPQAMQMIHRDLGVHRVVLPRELSIDELKTTARACPSGLSLEVFVHGALCYAVSGRCYWSSFLGGKSGLRGRCVQPCRRQYTQKNKTGRFFACMDFSLDVLARLLLKIPQVKAWKIEGRKKGPHYVYYTVRAYRMLRDHGDDAQSKKAALELLEMALGRAGTHYHFLPQHRHSPIPVSEHTGSGLLLGRVRQGGGGVYFRPAVELLADDLLRFGYEDERGHGRMRVRKYTPRRGRLDVKTSSGLRPATGAPVFLTDRREKALSEKITNMQAALKQTDAPPCQASSFQLTPPRTQLVKQGKGLEMDVYRKATHARKGRHCGVWLSLSIKKQLRGTAAQTWWWLPPVIWPSDSKEMLSLVRFVIAQGGRNFVLNAPWQISFFNSMRGLNIWAGPFNNIANPLALKTLADLGFQGTIVSPELSQAHYLELPAQSPLPLGIVLSGSWPLCISRIIAPGFKTEQPFTSPKGERAWVRSDGKQFWVYPGWEMNLRQHKAALDKAGYAMFVNLKELLPKGVNLKKRPGLWNWKIGLR